MKSGTPTLSLLRESRGPGVAMMKYSKALCLTLLTAFFVLSFAAPAQAQTDTYIGPVSSSNDWSSNLNWSLQGGGYTYPDNPTYNVVIGGTNGPVALDVSVYINTFSLASGGVLDMQGGDSLEIAQNMVNNGTIVLNNTQVDSVTGINFTGGVLSGTGAIMLNNDATWAQIDGTVTQDAGHTISGDGEIDAALTNYGVVNANAAFRSETLTLQTENMTNNNVMEASNGAVLAINGITVTQGTNGQLLANGGNVQMEGNVTISGGALNSSTGNSIFIVESGTTTFNSIVNNAPVAMAGGSTVNITGSFANEGAILVNYNQVDTATVLNFSGVTVTGSGAIILGNDASEAQVTGILTQEAGHTISGDGEINAALTNYGVVNANANYRNKTLTLETQNMTNNNVMEASNGGTLEITGITVTQGTNGQLLANGGNVQFDGGATISGGALNSSTSTSVFIVGSTATLNSLTNNATVKFAGGDALNVTGSFTDNGSVVVNDNQADYPTVANFIGVTVSGSGTFILDNSDVYAQVTGTLTQEAAHSITGEGQINGTLTNYGTVNSNVSSDTLAFETGKVTNYGEMQASNGGTLSFAPGLLTNLSGSTLTSGTYEADANSTIIMPGSITVNAASVILNGGGSTFVAINGLAVNEGGFAIFNGRSFTTLGTLANYGVLVTGSDSMLTVDGAFTQFSSGTLAGSGTYSATSFTLAGTISPGETGPGKLTLDGSTTFMSTLKLAYELGSLSGTNDRIGVVGNFTLAGTLNITALTGFGIGKYDLIDYSGGTFINDTLGIGTMPGGFSYQILTNTSGQVDLMVTAAVPEPATWAMILGSLGTLTFGKRFRRRTRPV